MPLQGDCGCSKGQVDLMFKRAEQHIDDEIADRTLKQARYWSDIYPVKIFPDGAGLRLEKVRFYGDIGPQYDAYDGWRKVQISRNAAAGALCGENDGCGHKWEEVGHGMETVAYDLMTRDLATKEICIKDIRTFWQYQETQNLIFRNLTNITLNMREQLNRNATMSFAPKHLALPNLPTNQLDPFNFPVVPSGIEIGKLTYRLLLQLYHPLGQEASEFALANIDGMPMFGVAAHPETLQDMVYEHPDIRKDLRYCQGTSCDLIKKYNFLEGMGPFIFMPDLYAPRYNRDADGRLIRVFPYDRNQPIEIGFRPVTNPAYHTAEFEYVQILTKDLLSLRTRRPLTSVGGETNFDAQVGLFNWQWSNPETKENPLREVGKYLATGEIGIEPGDFTDVPGILVKRKPSYTSIEYWGAATCPPEPVECDNVLPEQECPCPRVVNSYKAVAADEIVLEFDRATGLEAEDEADLNTVNGSFITGTVEEINAAGTLVRFSFADSVCPEPGYVTEIRCSGVDYCSADVVACSLCNILAGDVDLQLSRLLRAANGDTVTLFMGDETTLDVTIDTITQSTLNYKVNLTYANFCAHGGVVSVCVPTETEATCPGCSSSVLEACTPPEGEGSGSGSGS